MTCVFYLCSMLSFRSFPLPTRNSLIPPLLGGNSPQAGNHCINRSIIVDFYNSWPFVCSYSIFLSKENAKIKFSMKKMFLRSSRVERCLPLQSDQPVFNNCFCNSMFRQSKIYTKLTNIQRGVSINLHNWNNKTASCSRRQPELFKRLNIWTGDGNSSLNG